MKARKLGTAGALALAFGLLTVAGFASALSLGPNTTNSAPEWTEAEDQEGYEGSQLSFWIRASDADGDALSYSMLNKPDGAQFTDYGHFVWTPDYDESGDYLVRVSATDGTSTIYKWITITIHHVNVAPEIENPGNFDVDEGSLLRFWLTASDYDGDAVTFASPNLPDGATLRASDGLFRWTPDFDQEGTHWVRFDATDGMDASSTWVRIIVNHVNVAPVLDAIGTQVVNEADQLKFTVTGSDFDGDEISFSATDLPDGAFFRYWSGVFTWTPDYDQAGTYHVTFSVSDGQETVSEVVEFNVLNTNRLPVLDEVEDLRVKSKATASFVATATDADEETLTFSLGAGAPAAATMDPATGQFSWTTTSADSGRWMFEVTVTDGIDTVSTLASVTVGDVNKGPSLSFASTLLDAGTASPGDTVTAVFNLTNNAAWTEAIAVDAYGPGSWDVSASETSIFYLGPGEYRLIELTTVPDASALDGRAAMDVTTAWGKAAHAFMDVQVPVMLDVALDKAEFTMDEPVTGTVSATFENGAPAPDLAVTVTERGDLGFNRFVYVTLDAAGTATFAFPQDSTGANLPGGHTVTASVDDASNAESTASTSYTVASPLAMAALLPLLVIPAGAVRRSR